MKAKVTAKKVELTVEKSTSTALITSKNAAALQQQAKTLSQQVAGIAIRNEQECQSARTLLTRIITARDKATAFVKPIVDNAKEGLRLAKEQETTLVGPLEELRVSLKCTINKYLTDVMLKEREERERQQRIKEEHEAKLAASKRPERIKELVLPAIVEPPKMENTVVPMVPKYEITDESQIPDVYFKRVLDREKLWEEVRHAHKDGIVIVIPGVRIWEEASLTIRNR